MKHKLRKLLAWLLRVLKSLRYLIFTSLGTYMVLLTLGIGLAAMNTGNNLIYLIFGMMLGFITASGIFSETSLRGLEIDWIFPGQIFAGEPSQIRLVLKNAKKSLPSFGIRVESKILKCEEEIQGFESFFLCVRAGSQEARDWTLSPSERGEVELYEVRVETTFPFGFFRKYLYKSVARRFIVYPRILDIKKLELDAGSAGAERQRTPARGQGEDFWGMREFHPDDDPRRISWKASAKRERLMIAEMERENQKSFVFTFFPDARIFDDKARTESLISFAATAAKLAFEAHCKAGFAAPDIFLAPSDSRKNLQAVFRYLALIDAKRFAKPEEQTGSQLPSGIPAISIPDLWMASQNPAR